MPDDFNPREWRGVDPVDPSVPMQRGIGGQGFPDYSPINIYPELGEKAPYTRPPPLPFPKKIARDAVDDHVLLMQKVVQSIISAPFSRDLLQAFLQETSRQGFTPVHMPPWPEMPIKGRQLADVQSATVNAASSTTLITLTVPRGHYGFVAWVGQDTQNDTLGAGRTDWANLQWTLALQPPGAGASPAPIPIPGWIGITFQKGQIEAPTRVNIFIPEGWSLLMVVTNTSLAGIPSVTGRLDGWIWPFNLRTQSVDANAHVVG